MDSVRAWLQDKKNLPIVAAGTAIILVAVVLVILRSSGKLGGGAAPVDTGYTGAPASPTSPVPGAPPMGPTPPGAVGPGVSAPGIPTTAPLAGVPAPGAMGGPTPSTAQAGPSVVSKQPPILPYRKDPFMPFAGRPTMKKVLASMLPGIHAERLAPASVIRIRELPEAEQIEVLPPQPFRRMAGVLMNGRLSAILETDGQIDIVRPGMEISRGGSRVLVESIEPSAIVLKTLDTRKPMTIRVNMAGAVQAPSSGVPPETTPSGAGTAPMGPPGAPMGPISPM